MRWTYWIAFTAMVGATVCSSCDGSARPKTTEEIVARCAEAMSGGQGIESLRSLRFRVRSPDRPEPVRWEIERPNLVRKERADDLVLVFDGSRAAFLKAPPKDDGSPGEPHVVAQEDWHHFEMDVALYVPAFFDYPATYGGTTTVRESLAHLLRVDLPMGGVAVYAIDAESFLPVKVMLPGWDLARHLDDYQVIGGFTYFRRFWSGADEDNPTVMENLEVNPDIEKSRFAIPASVG